MLRGLCCQSAGLSLDVHWGVCAAQAKPMSLTQRTPRRPTSSRSWSPSSRYCRRCLSTLVQAALGVTYFRTPLKVDCRCFAPICSDWSWWHSHASAVMNLIYNYICYLVKPLGRGAIGSQDIGFGFQTLCVVPCLCVGASYSAELRWVLFVGGGRFVLTAKLQ